LSDDVLEHQRQCPAIGRELVPGRLTGVESCCCHDATAPWDVKFFERRTRADWLTRALGSSVVLYATLSGCVPLVSRHDPVRVEAARFVDRESGATVPEVLVIPRFASYSGVATGHGSGNMAKAALVAEPRIHRSGEVLLLPGGSVLGLWWAFVVVNLPRFGRHPRSHESAVGVCHDQTQTTGIHEGVQGTGRPD